MTDYFPYVLAVISIWSVVLTRDLSPLAEEWYGMTGIVEIVREATDQSSLRGTAIAKASTGELASANSEDGGLSTESVGEPLEPRPTLSDDSIAGKIREAWIGTGEEDIAVAVAKSESGLRTDAMGWNCYYINAQGKQYSKACLPQDRAKAWSVDCGVMQINHIGKTCPEHLFDPDENIKIGKEKYDNSEKRIGIGFYPWMAWRNNLHLKYL